MKVYIPNESGQQIGGALSFARNFRAGSVGRAQIVATWQEADVLLIVGATMTDRDEMTAAREAGKAIVFRVDNVPRDSRNRGTAFSRMRDFARMADVVVYQSEWAKEYAGYLCGDGTVIHNGVDTSIFKPEGEKLPRDRSRVFLYVHYNRDENKRFPEAQYHFHKEWLRTKDCELWLVGRFEDKLIEYHFDFFAGEPVRYLGVVENPIEMAKIMRSSDVLFAPYFMDAAPNTVMEAMACGCKVELVNPVGGTQEIVEAGPRSAEDMASEYIALFELALADTSTAPSI